MNLITIDCPLCGSSDYRLLFVGKDREHPIPGDFPIVECKSCDLVYLNPRPDNDSLSECYPDEYDSYAYGVGFAGKIQKILRKRAALKISNYIPKGSKVLEIGCATGDLLSPLRDVAGMEVKGVEFSAYAAGLARERHGLKVHVGTLESFDGKAGTFDAVVMRNVLEHLPDPKGDLERAQLLLKKGGYIFIEIPNYDSLDRMIFGKFWYGYSTPRHLTLPSVKTVTKLLNSTGFDVVKINHSVIPNNWIGSLKNFFEGVCAQQDRFKFLNFRNVLLLIVFMPISLTQAVFSLSGRIQIVSRKASGL